MEIRQRIVDSYIHYWKEHAKSPDSVYRFSKDLGITERDFFERFSNFSAVEDAFWFDFINGVIAGIEAGPEFASFTARQQYLTFGFGYLEKALDHRTLLLLRIAPLSLTCHPTFLQGFERSVKAFAQRVLTHGRSTGEIANRGRLTDIYPKALYMVFRSLIQFNLKDRSIAFERSDAYWEKSVNLAFDLMRTHAIDSAFDLAKFLVPEPVASR